MGKYSKFYAEFGAVLKEGLGEDFANKDRLAKLRFASSTTDTDTDTDTDTVGVGVGVSVCVCVCVCVADYKTRMKEGQVAIYYISADTAAAAKNSPQLEVFKKKGIEVLLMTDHVGRRCSRSLQAPAGQTKEALKEKVQDVRVTTRLVDGPACLVVRDDGMSTQLARMLKQAGQAAPDVKLVLEVNAEHALVKKLDGSVHCHDLAHILFDQALLAEGGLPADPAAFVKRVNALLVWQWLHTEDIREKYGSGAYLASTIRCLIDSKYG